MNSKLTANQRHILRLTAKDADADGWARVSKLLWPFIADVPDDLLAKRPDDDGGFVRLTSAGQAIERYA